MARGVVLLSGALLCAAGRLPAQSAGEIANAGRVLSGLVETYGVSGDEGRVRDAIRQQLPKWARPQVDSAGNLWVRAGRGDPVVVFVAHMDETGFMVDSIRSDGILVLSNRGGFLPWLWEATSALVQTRAGVVPGVFLPRDSIGRNPTRGMPGAMRVDVGAASRAEAQDLGVQVGDMVTNSKQFTPLAGRRATARSFDDRVGSTAQLLAINALDRSRLSHEVIFLWVVREEIGLEGSAAAAATLGTSVARVHAIDTFVSSESPLDPHNFAYTPIGAGPVARVVDNSSVTPPALVDTLRALAAKHRIPLQLGTTNGGNDGSAFAPWGVVDVPIGWPLRYSHSPAETIDLKDVVWLADLIRAIAEEW